MSVSKATSCQACGAAENLIHCVYCASRLTRGVAVAVCSTCTENLRKLEALGKVQSGSSDAETFLCLLCQAHQRQQEEDQLVRAVGGPSPTDLLRMVASTAPWFLTLSRATPEAKLSALGKLKRQMDHTTTEQELASGVASRSCRGVLVAAEGR